MSCESGGSLESLFGRSFLISPTWLLIHLSHKRRQERNDDRLGCWEELEESIQLLERGNRSNGALVSLLFYLYVTVCFRSWPQAYS